LRGAARPVTAEARSPGPDAAGRSPPPRPRSRPGSANQLFFGTSALSCLLAPGDPPTVTHPRVAAPGGPRRDAPDPHVRPVRPRDRPLGSREPSDPRRGQVLEDQRVHVVHGVLAEGAVHAAVTGDDLGP